MLIIGLTGSMGMGKSAAAERFRFHGIPVCNADSEVHKLYAGKAAPLIEAAFPGTTREGVVDRAKLSAALAADAGGFKTLEAIVHPLVQSVEREFLHDAARVGAAMAVLEIPLLLETGGDKTVDVVIVVSAPREVQETRVLARPGMTRAKLEALLSRQLPDAEKRRRADFVVDTGGAIADSQVQIDSIVAALANRSASAFERYWA